MMLITENNTFLFLHNNCAIINYILFLFFYVRLSYLYFFRICKLIVFSFFDHLLYIGLFLFSNEGRGVSFVTDGIVDSVFDELINFFVTVG